MIYAHDFRFTFADNRRRKPQGFGIRGRNKGRIMEGRIMRCNPCMRSDYSPLHYSPYSFAESSKT